MRKLRGSYRQWKMTEIRRFTVLWNAGFLAIEIAEALDRSVDAIRQKRREIGLEARTTTKNRSASKKRGYARANGLRIRRGTRS